MKADKLLDIAKRRGFFWQSSQIYSPIAGFYDYAHLGASLKRKWENVWREYFLNLDDNFHEIQVCQVMPEDVFRASGHLESFVDPIVKCKKCLNVERADHIIEAELGGIFEGVSLKRMEKIIKENKIRCPKCKGELAEVGILNMMFPLEIGTGKTKRTGYLSPETAQGAYVNFKHEFEALRKRLPMGLAAIGKAFRNEISPRNVLIRQREFTQAELQVFFDPDNIRQHPRFREIERYRLRVFPVKNRSRGTIKEVAAKDAVRALKLPKFYVYHMARMQQFYLDVLGLPKGKFRFRELDEDERAFYNKYHWDVEMDLESVGGFREVAGLHYRADHDLSGHQKVSGVSMEVDVDGKKILPHILELSFGVDRNIYALFELAYREEKERDVMLFPRRVSPFDAGIFPLVNKDNLPEKARGVKRILQESGFNVFYDSSGSIGRRYRRIDEAGVAAGITIDYDSLKRNDVTLRDRDTMKQIRARISDLPETLRSFINGRPLNKLGVVIK
jgi:glycyl-tRNA synthetase